jgi:predicted Ser/Thr protein kinase
VQPNSCVPFLDDGRGVQAITDRIAHSTGGALLVTGYRGTGKTTTVMRALDALRPNNDTHSEPVSAILNVARPINSDQLLFLIMRRVFEAFRDSGILELIPPEVRREVGVAYARTSMSMSLTQKHESEHSRSASIGAAGALLQGLAPSLGRSRRSSSSFERQASFLAYSDADVEHDFLRIVGLLRQMSNTPVKKAGFWARLRRPRRTWNGHLIIVLDELDKLTATDAGTTCLTELLTRLKNVLTVSGAHFIFVGGPDLHELYLSDARRGGGLYESVFAFHHYVPCTWGKAQTVLQHSVDPGTSTPPRLLTELSKFLEFKGHGAPRSLLAELNSLVQWEGKAPYLDLSTQARQQAAFFDRLESVLALFHSSSKEEGVLSSHFDLDRWRLATYLAAEWILRRDGDAFSASDVVVALSSHPVGSSGLDQNRVHLFLNHLAAHDILEKVRGTRAPDLTYVPDLPQSHEPAFRLLASVRQELRHITDVNAFATTRIDQSLGLDIRGLDNFTINDEIGVGGMGRVYRAEDKALGRMVAIKVLSKWSAAEPEMLRRFRREADVARILDHPNLVKTHAILEDQHGRLAIVMELLEGLPLSQVVAKGSLPAQEAIQITIQLLSAVTYLEEMGLMRLDLKPSNIILEVGGRAVIIDFGLLKPGDSQDESGVSPADKAITQSGLFVGTPNYAAPEQIEGGRIDSRVDIYSVGLVLFEMLTGRPARDAHGSQPWAQTLESEIDIPELRVSSELAAVVSRACARLPEERYDTAASMAEAIRATPEGRAHKP